LEKVIDLKNDPVFRRAIHLGISGGGKLEGYLSSHSGAGVISEPVQQRTCIVRERIRALSRLGKLDATDLQIIAMRQRTPMPTWREMGADLHMTKQAVHFRAKKIKKSIVAGLKRDF